MVVNNVRFVGDAAQLLATYRSIGAAATALKREIDAVNRAQLQAAGFQERQPNQKRTTPFFGPGVGQTKTEFDAVNKVLRSTTDTFISIGKQGKILTGTFEQVHGDIGAITKATERYNDVLATNRLRASATKQAYDSAVGPINQRIKLIRQQLDLEVQQGIISRHTADSILSREKRLRDYDTLALKTAYHEEVAAGAARLQAPAAAIRRAIAAPPSVAPAGFELIPKSALAQLQARGLGATPAALFGQNAKAGIYEDLIHGTTRASVQFERVNGALVQGQVEWDKYGKVITRFGGNLSGLQNILNQTVRNLQKVIQWTVATTVVFGSLAFAASELQVLVNLDKNLKQLSITSQSTAQDTQRLFSGLADVAYQTATPLEQIVKSADDIALAVRDSGSSAHEYQQDILNLAQAVGIYTNLTGTDTVQATDLLTSAMKQLGIQTEDVVGVLSKVTAVAGGQSNAISSITQVLAVMSEAARQAGLSIDETIATAQVLTQVTAKSPAEIATAFKNLTGSLDSVAGKKALAKFGIGLKDEATGQLRNILDIYGEISDKIRQGIIPANEVKGLVKAIAGGPRRVPDAAALLSNIDTIQQVTTRSVDATNEALIANAKILDTTQAKLTQIKVLVDKFAYEKFGPALKQSVEIFLDAATHLFEFLNKLDAKWVSTALQAGAFLLALKLGTTLLARFGAGLLGMANGLIGSGAAALTAAKGMQAYAAASQAANVQAAAGKGKLGILAAGLGNKDIAKAGIGGAISGAALSAISGGTPGQIIGGGLQGLGGALFLAPSPEPFTKVAGAAAFAVGTVLQLVTASHDVQKATEDVGVTAEKVVSAFSAYDEARGTLEGLGNTQKELSASIEEINSHQKKSADELAILNDFQSQYIKNALAMADANVKLKDSQDILNNVIGPEFSNALAAAKNGLLSKQQINELLKKYQNEILKKTRPDITLPEDINVPTPQKLPAVIYSNEDLYKQQVKQAGSAGNVPYPTEAHGREIRLDQNGNEILGKNVDFSLRELELLGDGYKKVKLLFKGDLVDPTTFQVTGQNLDLISQAIQKLVDSGDEAGPRLQASFNKFLQGTDAFRAADTNLAIFGARIQAMQAIGDPTAATLTKVLDLITKIVNIAKEKGDTDTLFKAQAYLADVLNGKIKVTKDNLGELATIYGQQLNLIPPTLPTPPVPTTDRAFQHFPEPVTKETADAAQNRLRAIQAIVDDLGIDFTYLGKAGADGLGLISEEAATALEDLDKVKQSLESSYAEKSGNLRAQFQGGDISKADYDAQAKQLDALAAAVSNVTARWGELITLDFSSYNEQIDAFEQSLTTIPGLQDAVGLSGDQLLERLFSLAETYGLTGKEVDKLGGKLVALGKTLQQLNGIKAYFHLAASVDTAKALATLKAMRNIIAAGGEGDHTGGDTSKLDAAIAQLSALQNTKDIGSDIKDIFYNAKGSGGVGNAKTGGGGAGSSKAGAKANPPDVSTIDVPDAIANAYNRDALIQEAIRRAKKLQSTIPGAAKDAKNDIVEILKGTQNLLEVRGVKDDLLRKALEELADVEKKRLEFETKADTIRRIRVGSGSFAAIANVPVNSTSGVSLGGANNVNVTLNLNGTVLTPAQLAQFADLVASAIKRQIAN